MSARRRQIDSPFWCYGAMEDGFVPVQSDGRTLRNGLPLVGVRREIAEAAYECYARRYGTSQSFDRLHERGGFGVGEMLMLLIEDMPRTSDDAARPEGDGGKETP